MRKDLTANIEDPVDRINNAVKTVVDNLNENSGGRYLVKTTSTNGNKVSFICDSGFKPVVANATYIGTNCVDKLDGVWRLPCDNNNNEWAKTYLNTLLTCPGGNQSLDKFTSPEPPPSLSLAPNRHIFSSVYLSVPPNEIDKLGNNANFE